MTVCIDTNVVLQMRAPQNPMFRLLVAWTRGCFSWAITTDVWLEYEEIVTAKAGQTRWLELMELVSFTRRQRPDSLREISPTYRFRLITACPDDDKFADCAIAAEADFIITDDGHFNALIGSGYKPRPITPEEFMAQHLTAPP
jgi:uncharacterized protein